jgi:hypothetical protein
MIDRSAASAVADTLCAAGRLRETEWKYTQLDRIFDGHKTRECFKKPCHDGVATANSTKSHSQLPFASREQVNGEPTA